MKIIGYAICLDNVNYTVSLELHKIYPIVEPYGNDPESYFRIIDESDEDYLYPAEAFAVVDLSPAVKKQIDKSFEAHELISAEA